LNLRTRKRETGIRWWAAIATVVTLAGLPVQATAEVVVDRRFSTDVFKQQVYIPAGSYWTLVIVR